MSILPSETKFYKCENGHEMTWGNTRRCGWSCDTCRKSHNSNPGFYWYVCSTCDSDYCPNCYEQRVVIVKKEGYQAGNPNKFYANDIVYCPTHSSYVKVMKVDEASGVYTVKLLNQEKNLVSIDLLKAKSESLQKKCKQSELTKFITVNLKIVNSEEIDQTDICSYKVNIYDKVAKLGKLSGKDGKLLFDGKVIENPDDDSFVKLCILN